MSTIFFKLANGLSGLVGHITLLNGLQIVLVVYLGDSTLFQHKPLSEVNIVGLQSQRGLCQDADIVSTDLIDRLAILVADQHTQAAVGTGELLFRGPKRGTAVQREGCQQQKT